MYIRTGLISALVAGFVLVSSAQAESLKRIRKEADFQALVVGKTFGDDQTTMVIAADGKISGKFQNDKIIGAWKWSNGYFCRNVNVGQRAMGNDCQVVKTDSTEVSFTRQKGKGNVAGPYTFK